MEKDLEAEELEVIELLVTDLHLYKDVQLLLILHQRIQLQLEAEELEDLVQDLLQIVVQDLEMEDHLVLVLSLHHQVEDFQWNQLVVTLGTQTTEIEVDLEVQVQEDTLALSHQKDQAVLEMLEDIVHQKETLEEQGDLLETLAAVAAVAQVLLDQLTVELLEEMAVTELQI